MSENHASYRRVFLQLAVECGALQFGDFTLKSGRKSPYFFNAGAFQSGQSLSILSECYAQAARDSGPAFDMLFGPAYKGIPLAVATSISLATRHGRDVPWAFNRKEDKDHGEGGRVVGAPLKGRVLIVDDVVSAGTSVRESVSLIQAAGAEPAGVLIALDRQERGTGAASAVAELGAAAGIPVISVARLDDLVEWLEEQPDSRDVLQAMQDYRREFGVKG